MKLPHILNKMTPAVFVLWSELTINGKRSL